LKSWLISWISFSAARAERPGRRDDAGLGADLPAGMARAGKQRLQNQVIGTLRALHLSSIRLLKFMREGP
jgi:hypothetical protein